MQRESKTNWLPPFNGRQTLIFFRGEKESSSPPRNPFRNSLRIPCLTHAQEVGKWPSSNVVSF